MYHGRDTQIQKLNRVVRRESNTSVPLDRAVEECALGGALPQPLPVAAVGLAWPCQHAGPSSPHSSPHRGHIRTAQLLEPGLHPEPQPEPLSFPGPRTRRCVSNRTVTAGEMRKIVISKTDELSKMSIIL